MNLVEDKTIRVRCPSEPISAYLRKGGNLEDTVGKGCLCNNLTANAGYGSPKEPFVVTFHDIKAARELFFKYGEKIYVKNVFKEILSKSDLFRPTISTNLI